jgi:hypothetical protein
MACSSVGTGQIAQRRLKLARYGSAAKPLPFLDLSASNSLCFLDEDAITFLSQSQPEQTRTVNGKE